MSQAVGQAVTEKLVSLAEFRAAQARLAGVAVHTPLVRLHHPCFEGEIYLKAENRQPIGSFKLRGAYNKIAQLSPDERARGVITYSSGNHAQGVAYAARALGIKAVIVMPHNAPETKRRATEALGAEIVLTGPASTERKLRAEVLAFEHGYIMVPPYDDGAIIAGQGTCGLEILADLPDVDLVLAPVSGGGLLSGVATAIKLARPEVRVVGIEPALAADAQESFETGKLATWPAELTTRTIADGLRTQSLGHLNFAHIRAYVDTILTVSDDQIREAMRVIHTHTGMVAEPSGAATTAALLFHERDLLPYRKAVAIVSGGNVEPSMLAAVLEG
jgi:threonine dehydratase